MTEQNGFDKALYQQLGELIAEVRSLRTSVESSQRESTRAIVELRGELRADLRAAASELETDIQNVRATVTTEVFALREDKEKEHQSLRDAIADASARLKVLEEWRWRIIGAAGVAAAGGGAGLAAIANAFGA